MSREIRKEVLVDAPVDVVWRALTEADELTRWFPGRHRGVRRDLIGLRERVPFSRADAFARLLGPDGLSTRGSLFLEMEPDPDGTRAGFWLSTYGLDPGRLAAIQKAYEASYRRALGLPS